MNKCNMRRINKFLLMNGFLVMVPLIICGKKKGSAESHEAAKDKAKKSTVRKVAPAASHKKASVKHDAAEKPNKGNKKNATASSSVVVSAPSDASNGIDMLKNALKKEQSKIDKMKSDFKAQHGVELQLDQNMQNEVDVLSKKVVGREEIAAEHKKEAIILASTLLTASVLAYVIPMSVNMALSKTEGGFAAKVVQSHTQTKEQYKKVGDVFVAGAKKVFTVTKEFVTKSGVSLQALAQKAGEQAGNIYNGYDKKAFVEWAERAGGSAIEIDKTDRSNLSKDQEEKLSNKTKEAINILAEKVIYNGDFNDDFFSVDSVRGVSKELTLRGKVTKALNWLRGEGILTKPNMKKGEFVSVLTEKARKMVTLAIEGGEEADGKDKNEKLREKNNATHENMDFYKY